MVGCFRSLIWLLAGQSHDDMAIQTDSFLIYTFTYGLPYIHIESDGIEN